MSLINNALKKAQRQRSGDPAPLTAGGGAQGRRGHAMPMQTLVLIGFGAAVLIAVSVAFTVFLLRRPAPNSPSTVPPSTVVALPSTSQPSEPATVEPSTVIQQPSTVAPPTDTPATVVSLPTVLPSTVEPPPVVSLPTLTTPPSTGVTAPPSTVAEPTVPSSRQNSQNDGGTVAASSEAIYAFIDKLQVMGIRSSGSDSRVLMNDRVYRVNDIVDRTLMLKLTEVRSDRLIFVDANGVSYTKSF
jgi:type IV secretory pathway VirB10-like protein